MKVGPTNLPAFFNNNADFQAYVTGIHNALAALGFVQTADTGQINPATVAVPTAINQASGYEIWKFADAHQADVPIFFKIEYGSSTFSTGTAPGMWITVGSGSNGTGTLTGQVSTRFQIPSGNGKSIGVQLPMYMCSDGSDLSAWFNVDIGSTGFGFGFYIGRPRDTSGAVTTEGVWLYCGSNNGTSGTNSGPQQFIPASGSVPGNFNGFPAISPNYVSKSAQGDNACMSVAMLPIFGNWRFFRLALCNPSDFPSGGTLTATIFGASHTFLSIALSALNAIISNQNGNGGNPGIIIPWE